MDPTSDPLAFERSTDLRAWFRKNHSKASELWIRFYRLESGRPSVTYPEALDEALCAGWIDGIRKRADDESYIMRFSPRNPKSNWSTVNIRKAEALIASGRMTPAGLRSFEGRKASAEERYSYENRPHDLPADAVAAFKRDKKAWKFWREQPPGYRRTVTWWIVSAKRSETRARRVALLIEHSRKSERIPPLVSPTRRKRTQSR